MISPANKLKQEIINLARMWNEEPEVNLSTNEEIDELYDEMRYSQGNYSIWDAISEIRCGEHETEVPCDYSRHYESKSVAMKCVDNSWVGWTYWYGGGKHGEPEAIDWIEYAYNLDVEEKEQLVVVRKFKKVEQ